jgi:hypothetical protein
MAKRDEKPFEDLDGAYTDADREFYLAHRVKIAIVATILFIASAVGVAHLIHKF